MSFAMPDALAITRCDPELRNFSKSGGRTGAGREQRVFADAGFWTVAYEFVVSNQDRARAYRAMQGRLRQGEEIVARICDAYKLEGATTGQVGAAATLRATSLQITGISADLEAGVHFSIGQRLYRIVDVTSQVNINIGLVTSLFDGDAWDDGDVWVDDLQFTSTVKILPPLRAAAASGATVNFANLSLLCVLQDMSDGDLSLDLIRHGRASLTLVESI